MLFRNSMVVTPLFILDELTLFGYLRRRYASPTKRTLGVRRKHSATSRSLFGLCSWAIELRSSFIV